MQLFKQVDDYISARSRESANRIRSKYSEMDTEQALLLFLRQHELVVSYQLGTSLLACSATSTRCGALRGTRPIFCAEALVEPLGHVILERPSVALARRSLPNSRAIAFRVRERCWGVV